MAKRASRIGKISAMKMGDWDGVIDYLGKLGPKASRVVQRAQKEEAKKVIDKVIGHIRSQDLAWLPLSRDYQERKSLANRNNIYLNTEVMIESMGVWKVGKTYFAGIKKGAAYKNRSRGSSKTTVDAVARWMEFGTRHMPARPLWNPTFREVGGAYGIRNRIAKALYNDLKSTAHPAFTITYTGIRRRVPRYTKLK